MFYVLCALFLFVVACVMAVCILKWINRVQTKRYILQQISALREKLENEGCENPTQWHCAYIQAHRIYDCAKAFKHKPRVAEVMELLKWFHEEFPPTEWKAPIVKGFLLQLKYALAA